ncbi:hypothetical protein BU17DRAFT_60032 [Hysterangium stoloniferum]|nr:hypothetical protein BU17DRAFT_60032 [Hysterangium stoloniferum]
MVGYTTGMGPVRRRMRGLSVTGKDLPMRDGRACGITIMRIEIVVPNINNSQDSDLISVTNYDRATNARARESTRLLFCCNVEPVGLIDLSECQVIVNSDVDINQTRYFRSLLSSDWSKIEIPKCAPPQHNSLAAIRADNVTKYSWVGAATVMVYDYGLTIGHEKSMWQRRWSLGKCLYLFEYSLLFLTFMYGSYKEIVRFLSCPYLHYRYNAGYIEYLVTVAPSFGGRYSLQRPLSYPFKVYAVYRQNKKVLMVLTISLALGVVASLILAVLKKPSIQILPLKLTTYFVGISLVLFVNFALDFLKNRDWVVVAMFYSHSGALNVPWAASSSGWERSKKKGVRELNLRAMKWLK